MSQTSFLASDKAKIFQLEALEVIAADFVS